MIVNKKAFAQANTEANLILDLYPNGFWSPNKQVPTYLVQELRKIKTDVTNQTSIITGLRHPGRSESNIETPHQQNFLSYMSCTGYKAGKNAPLDFTKTFDQVIVDANQNFRNKPKRTLAFNGTTRRNGKLRPEQEENLSWLSKNQSIESYSNVGNAFDDLFGNFNPQNQQNTTSTGGNKEMQAKHDILGALKDQRDKLRSIASADDKIRLDAYYNEINEMQKSFSATEVDRDLASTSCKERPARIAGTGNYFQNFRRIQDLSLLAIKCGMTNVVTLKRAHTGGQGVQFDFASRGKNWHDISHYREGGSAEQLMRINTELAKNFSEFCKRMSAEKDPVGRSLLDQSLLVHGSWIGDSQSHSNVGLVATLVGGAAGKLKLGQDVNRTQNLSSLWLTIMKAYGSQASSFGRSGHTYGQSNAVINELLPS